MAHPDSGGGARITALDNPAKINCRVGFMIQTPIKKNRLSAPLPGTEYGLNPAPWEGFGG
jgi:hypothetical protein